MDYVGFQARFCPHRLAVADLTFGRRWSYAGFDDFVARCVSLLRARGVAAGDRVACLAKNRAEIVALHLACVRLGALFVPLSWRLVQSELQAQLANCRPKRVWGDESAAALGIDCEPIDALCAQSEGFMPAVASRTDRDAPSLILYTSGTAGHPKGVLLSERSVFETAINFSTLGCVGADSLFLCDAPMFHTIGLIASVHPAFMQGAAIAISSGFVPSQTLARLADPELGVTHYFCVPQMAQALRRDDGFDAKRLSRLVGIFTGGATHPECQIRAWLDDGVAVVDGYGMSEAGTVFGMPVDRALIRRKAGAVGIPTPRVGARIVGVSGGEAAVGEPGELQLNGDGLFCGYWQDDAEYRQALTDDGWFRTGDIAVVDDEGFHRIVGRKKEIYISGGENVYPAEIEALLDGFPGIADCAVVGVDDEQWGEVGCLFYVPDGDARIDATDVARFLGDKLAKYKIPKHVRAVERIPRNGAGKVLKRELSRMAGDAIRAA